MQYMSLLLSCQGFLLGKIAWEEGMLLAHYQLPFEILYYGTKMNNQQYRNSQEKSSRLDRFFWDK
jgi:hypothetical protein